MKMRHSLKWLLVLLIAFAGNRAGAHEVSPEKRAALEEMFQITGSMKLGQQMVSMFVAQLTQDLRKKRPNIPQKALDILPEVVNGVVSENLDGLKEAMIQIYDEQLSLEDVQGLVRFYSSDLGQKVIHILPGMVQKSMVAGQKWGEALGPLVAQRVQERLAKEGFPI